jgi:hypothetical protein
MAQEGGPWAKGWQVGQKDMGSVCSATSVLLYLIVYIYIYIYGNRLNHKMTFQKVKMLVYQSTLYLSSRDCSHSQSVIDHYSPKDYIQSIEAWGSIGRVVQMVIVATCSIAHDASAAVVSWRADPPLSPPLSPSLYLYLGNADNRW